MSAMLPRCTSRSHPSWVASSLSRSQSASSSSAARLFCSVCSRSSCCSSSLTVSFPLIAFNGCTLASRSPSPAPSLPFASALTRCTAASFWTARRWPRRWLRRSRDCTIPTALFLLLSPSSSSASGSAAGCCVGALSGSGSSLPPPMLHIFCVLIIWRCISCISRFVRCFLFASSPLPGVALEMRCETFMSAISSFSLHSVCPGSPSSPSTGSGSEPPSTVIVG
mmetsp:Transcript_3609/g.8531  ORF Transcript_3609/g.8531 Transcript_3609/m.8531 type:complete len:224 (-) Transcript_3609:194-865(-)